MSPFKIAIAALALTALIGSALYIRNAERNRVKLEQVTGRIDNIKEDQASDQEIESTPIAGVIDALSGWIMRTDE